MTNKGDFTVLSVAKTQETRNMVVSINKDDDIVMAQQAVISEGSRKTEVFFKGAALIELENIYGVRDALNEAIEKLEGMGKL